jgi:hypothetical protein
MTVHDLIPGQREELKEAVRARLRELFDPKYIETAETFTSYSEKIPDNVPLYLDGFYRGLKVRIRTLKLNPARDAVIFERTPVPGADPDAGIRTLKDLEQACRWNGSCRAIDAGRYYKFIQLARDISKQGGTFAWVGGLLLVELPTRTGRFTGTIETASYPPEVVNALKKETNAL